MAFLEGKTPKERRNLILAVALGSVAVLGILYNFVLSGSKTVKRTGGTTTTATGRATTSASPTAATTAAPNIEDIRQYQAPSPIVYERVSFGDPVPGRNIFAYYVPPVRPVNTAVATNSPVITETPTPTPVPSPPIFVAGVAPSSVYARTGDFALEVAGDKFTPESRVFLNGAEVPTTFENPQRLRAQISSAVISSEGGRSVLVRTPDGSLFSNVVNLNVLPPPAPPFTYVGLLGKRNNKDTAVLKNRTNELLSVQRDDVVGGRFRLTAITEQSVELTDTELRVKHSLPFLEARNLAGGNPQMERQISPPPVSEQNTVTATMKTTNDKPY
jgi:hypothetical protein